MGALGVRWVGTLVGTLGSGHGKQLIANRIVLNLPPDIGQ